MASLNKAINKELFNNILPEYGSPRVKTPVWDEGQKMFICEEYESNAGNRYYRGIRFCNNIVVVEKVGLFHNWTYIDGIELYAFNNTRLELIQKHDYQNVFHNVDFIKKETQNMLQNYFIGVLKAQKQPLDLEYVKSKSADLVNQCYKSFLDYDYNTRLTQIVKTIEQK